jgi:hypothetical protein
MNLYRIKNWQDNYECNRTRELKSVKWIPIPVKLSGDGYSMMMDDEKGNRRKEGPAMFGTFIAIIELAACCDPRGDLIKASGEPHTFESIGRICRIHPEFVEKTIAFCVNTVKWIEIIVLDTNCGETATRCEIGAPRACITLPVLPVLQGDARGGNFENEKFGKRSKIKRGDLKNYASDVLLSENEFDRMVADWGESFTKEAIEKYNLNFNNKKAAVLNHLNHNLGIRDYVKRGFICQGKTPHPEQRHENGKKTETVEIATPEEIAAVLGVPSSIRNGKGLQHVGEILKDMTDN